MDRKWLGHVRDASYKSSPFLIFLRERMWLYTGFPSMGENCYMTPHKLPPGNHLFEITVTEFAEDAVDKFIPISHLIWW